MATTKTTTPISPAYIGAAVLGVALILIAAINLFSTMTPVAAANALLDERFEKAQTMPADLRSAFYAQLREDEVENLARKPSDPYGWARLSYLRLATLGDPKTAFAALFMSDFVSPYEAPQLPERAVMWYRYRSIETKDQQAYQDVLWQKAYSVEHDLTWKMALQNNLVQEAGESLKRTNSSFYDEWKARVATPR